MKTILVPTDFSEQSQNALHLASQIAGKLHAEVRLLHVIEQPSGTYFTAVSEGLNDQLDNAFLLSLMEKLKVQMEATVQEHRGIKMDYRIKIGHFYRSLVSYIQENDIDMVIMGTKGISGLDEMIVGSNAEKVVRHVKVPVLAIKDKIELDEVKEIVFGTSLTNRKEKVAAELKNIQQIFNAHLHLVDINTPNNFFRQDEAEASMQDFVDRYDLKNCSVATYSDITEEEGILRYADRVNANMIAMATHGRTGIMHLMSGSLTEDVVNHACRPVWSFQLK